MLGIDQSLLVFDQSVFGAGPIKAGGVPFMACRTLLFDEQEDRVGIAIDADFDDLLLVSALLSFSPEFAARPTVVRGTSRSASLLKRFLVHPCQHEHLMIAHILSDDGQ